LKVNKPAWCQRKGCGLPAARRCTQPSSLWPLMLLAAPWNALTCVWFYPRPPSPSSLACYACTPVFFMRWWWWYGLGCPWRSARQSGQVLESESVGATCSHPGCFPLRLRCISDPPSGKQQAGALPVHAIDSDSVKEHGVSFFFGSILICFFSVPKKVIHIFIACLATMLINKQMKNALKINFQWCMLINMLAWSNNRYCMLIIQRKTSFIWFRSQDDQSFSSGISLHVNFFSDSKFYLFSLSWHSVMNEN